MMCEIPSNALLADAVPRVFDGFSIGSNDLTQLTLGLDRDSGLVATLFDERDPAVKMLLSMAIQRQQARQVRRHLRPGPVGSPRSGRVADGRGHQSISLNPDTVVERLPGHDQRHFVAQHVAQYAAKNTGDNP
jgi:pyruvate,water dikinase